MSISFFDHHEIRFSSDQADKNRFLEETLFHKIWVTFLFVVFFLFLFIFL
jgi:hypothetical protein